METTVPTPRDTRIRLNKMEAWCQKNADRLGPAAVRLRALFELAKEPEHADYIEAEIRASTRQRGAAAEDRRVQASPALPGTAPSQTA